MHDNHLNKEVNFDLKKPNRIINTNLIRLTLCVISSNVLVYYAASPSPPSKAKVSITNEKFHKITLPIRNHSTFTKKQEKVPVTLLNNKNKIVIKKAWLHRQSSATKSHTNISNNYSLWNVEIKKNEITNLKFSNEAFFIAIPWENYVKKAKTKQKKTIREIKF